MRVATRTSDAERIILIITLKLAIREYGAAKERMESATDLVRKETVDALNTPGPTIWATAAT